jgi:hypothetical protein
VIDTAFGITGAICALMGTLGYLMYGTGVKDVVTFNLPPVSLKARVNTYCKLFCCKLQVH